MTTTELDAETRAALVAIYRRAAKRGRQIREQQTEMIEFLEN